MSTPSPVTVIGLGLMGRALAAAFLNNGHPTTVWNRSPGKADDLVADGAAFADSITDAVEASPLVVVCVSDYDVADELLKPVASTLSGRTLVNLTTASSGRAREAAEWAADHGIPYLDGAILAIPQGIGTAEAMLIYSGPHTVFAEHETTLKALGDAGTTYLGEDHGLSALYDMAVLSIMWGVLNSFLHGVALLGTANVDATTFAPMARTAINVTSGYASAYAQQIDEGDYTAADSTLAVHAEAMRHLLDESRELGISGELPKFFLQLADSAIAVGHADDGYAAMVERFRKPSP